MKSEKYKTVAIIGRIAYGIMCVESYLMQKYPKKEWSILVSKLWKITNLELWDEWMDEVIEIIPEYLFEFSDYESSNFEYLSKEDYEKLCDVFRETGNDVNNVLKLFYDLACSHAYSSIEGSGRESLEMLEELIQFIIKNEVKLPDDSEIMKISFHEKNGWGIAFDGISLSKILL